jgi:hypothetical protein
VEGLKFKALDHSLSSIQRKWDFLFSVTIVKPGIPRYFGVEFYYVLLPVKQHADSVMCRFQGIAGSTRYFWR